MAPSVPSDFSPDALVSEEDMEIAGDCIVLDARGNRIKFGEIYEYEKTVAVFIRHFFCGICQAYVEALAKIPDEAIEHAGTKIIVVGCGEPSLIDHYRATTKFRGLMYADPTRAVYTALGMTMRTLDGAPKSEQKKSYVPSNVAMNTLESIVGALKQPLSAITGKNGNISQLGGEFILGPGKTCHFANRMKHTQDHMEVADLMKLVGVQYP
jgi:hypothetical protein